jgi:hypothetical protein
MMTTPQPLTLGTPPCHAVFYPPNGDPRAALVMVPPLFDEQRCAHRALHAGAMALAGAGVAALHLNLTGTGNSDGRLEDVTLARWLGDIEAAMAWLRERAAHAPLILLGCRAGALLAAQLSTADRLLLLQPVISGKDYLRQTRTRRMIQDKLTGDPPRTDPREIEGQLIADTLMAELEALRLPDAPLAADTRLLQCSFNANPTKEYADLLTRWSLPAASFRTLVQEPFWLPHTPYDYPALTAALVQEVLI